MDEITLAAAQRQLRVYNNATSIAELTGALQTPANEVDFLLNSFASFGANYFFDTEFAAALKEIQDNPSLSDASRAQQALDILVAKAKHHVQQLPHLPEENRENIYQVADKYLLSLATTASLLAAYNVAGAGDFKVRFTTLFEELAKINPNEKLNASLAAKTLLYQLTPKDAQDITLTSGLLRGKILEDDLMVIACRYLKSKTPQDIVDTFEAVLKRLPHVQQKEENLGLAVQVLLDGTEAMFEKAQKKATLRREQILLRKALARHSTFAGYEYDLAERFAGQKDFVQIEQETNQLLAQLPH